MKLEVRNGNFGYEKNPILKDINFEINNNTVMTILGPNGVGKTTLLKCIMGFLKWHSGENYMDEKPLSSYSDKVFWQRTSIITTLLNIGRSWKNLKNRKRKSELRKSWKQLRKRKKSSWKELD